MYQPYSCDFKDVRRIRSLDEVNSDEYGIVMAFAEDDFHFVKVEEDRISHKMGMCEIDEIDTIDEGFGNRYISKRFYFAKKKN